MEEYYEMRKVLLALLCVGDPINCIHCEERDKYKGMMGHNRTTALYETRNTITVYTVHKFIDNEVIQLKLPGGGFYSQTIEFIYAHEGQLYIWNGDKIFNYNHAARLAMVIDAINSPDTVYLDETKRR
jgi:hypothetical protein